MNKEYLVSEITAALKLHDKTRVSILRQVKNEIDIKEKDSGSVVADADVVALLKKVLKQTGETLEGSVKAGTNEERTALLRAQVDILTAYLPQQVSGDALATIIDRVLSGGGIAEKRDMGRAIGLVTAECGGNCDKAEVARIVGGKLR